MASGQLILQIAYIVSNIKIIKAGIKKNDNGNTRVFLFDIKYVRNRTDPYKLKNKNTIQHDNNVDNSNIGYDQHIEIPFFYKTFNAIYKSVQSKHSEQIA